MPENIKPRQKPGTKPGSTRKPYRRPIRLQRKVRERLDIVANDMSQSIPNYTIVDRYSALWSMTRRQVYNYIDRVKARWAEIPDRNPLLLAQSKHIAVTAIADAIDLARKAGDLDKVIDLIQKLEQISKK